MEKIPFIITVDTEGDNLWSHPMVIETKNTQGLYRFQELCNQYGYKPVYLTDYEMAMDDEFVKFGRNYFVNGQCEIGMHLHAWNSPPAYNLTDNDMIQQPFLYEYPLEIIEEKVKYMTELLETRFLCPIVSHRAGRWAMSDEYFSVLEKYGYLVDCSVTPGVDWSKVKGRIDGNGGTNYRSYSHYQYFVNKEKQNGILEVPMSIEGFPRYKILGCLDGVKNRLPGLLYKLCYRNIWLRPSADNLNDMKALVEKSITSGCKYLEFMIHSSELSAGLNPNFVTEDDMIKLYKDLDELFKFLSAYVEGYTLREFYELNCKREKYGVERQ